MKEQEFAFLKQGDEVILNEMLNGEFVKGTKGIILYLGEEGIVIRFQTKSERIRFNYYAKSLNYFRKEVKYLTKISSSSPQLELFEV